MRGICIVRVYGVDIMPLLVAQRNTHQAVVAVLDRCHSGSSKKLLLDHHHQQPLDFTMSKYKPSTRHQLYRQLYSAEDSLQYDRSGDDQGECTLLMLHTLWPDLKIGVLLVILTVRQWRKNGEREKSALQVNKLVVPLMTCQPSW